MRILKDYIYENIEYLVTDGRDGFNPSADGIRMLASRKVGVGADKIIVFHGSAECPSFTVYDADGNKVEASREDVLVFAYYLRCEGIPASAVEIVHALGDQAILDIHDLHLPEMEVRLTEHFICQMSGVDEAELAC